MSEELTNKKCMIISYEDLECILQEELKRMPTKDEILSLEKHILDKCQPIMQIICDLTYDYVKGGNI